MDRLESMSVFVAVVETGGFSAASRHLNMPLATVSRKVTELEQHLKVRLLMRTTRAIRLTEAGEGYFVTCRRLLDELGEAERSVAGEFSAPRGTLVIAAPIVFGRIHLLPVISAFLSTYPDVRVDLRLADRLVNLDEEHIDVTLRIAHLDDSSFTAMKIGDVRQVICGSPEYFKKRGTPMTPADLSGHDTVAFTMQSDVEWPFIVGGQVRRVRLEPRLRVTTAEAALDAAASGSGLTRLLCYQVAAALADGRLRAVLEDFELPSVPAQLVYRGGRLLPQKMRAFLDFARPRLAPRLQHDQQIGGA